MKGKPKMKTTIETLSKKWKRPIYKISEVIRIYEEEEFVEEIILEEVNQNTPKETFTLKDAASYAKDIYDQYGLNVDRVDFREKEIIFGEWKELDEDDRDYIGACADKLFLCDENDQYGWRSYLYNLEDEKDIFNIDKNVLYLMKKGRLIDIENKEIVGMLIVGDELAVARHDGFVEIGMPHVPAVDKEILQVIAAAGVLRLGNETCDFA